MKITLLQIGKTEDHYLKEGLAKYQKRLMHYIRLELTELPQLKNTAALSREQQKAKEADLILAKLAPADFVVLLDERGKELTSIAFAEFVHKKMVASVPNVVFIIGGPYGFDDSLYRRANDSLSFSKMTFSHQMIRLFFLEQLYRAFTILNREPYHHE